MNSPDPRLMRLFNTEEVYQQKLAGGLPYGLNLLAAEYNVENSRENVLEELELREQAHAMNERMREARAILMAPVQEKLRHTHVPVVLSAGRVPGMIHGGDVPVGMDEGMVRMASAAGRALAHFDLNALEKDAGIGGSLLTAGKNILGGAGRGIAAGFGRLDNKITNLGFRAQDAVAKGIHKVDKGITNTLTRTNEGISNVVNRARQAPGRLGQRIENWSQGVGQKLESAGTGVKPPAAAPPAPAPAKAPVNNSTQVSYRQPAPTPPPSTRGNAGPTPAAKPDAPAESTGGASQAPKSPPQPAQAAPAAPAQPGFLQKARLADAQGNLDWGKVRNTALGLGATAAVGYGLFRGAKALGGVMNQEHRPDQYNEGGPMPAYGVNQYGGGTPDRSTPFAS